MDRKVHFIPPYKSFRETKVGIYCRVSSNSTEQLRSLSVQVSALTRLVAATPQWNLVDVYMDVASAKSNSERLEYSRMLDDAKNGRLNIVLTKSVSRFGRDTVDCLEGLRILRDNNVRVIFEQEQLDTADTESNLMISIIESISQAENENRSDNIKWGHRKRAAQGTSKLYDRKCYGYDNDENGNLIIIEDEAKVVREIFRLYLSGLTSIGISKQLFAEGIKTAKGNNKWAKQTIDKILDNLKYTGDVVLFDKSSQGPNYISENNNPAIIDRETFKVVQEERKRRSNVHQTEDGLKRNSKKYSSKKS